MSTIIQLGTRKDVRIQKLKLVFDELARFCDRAHDTFKNDAAVYKHAWRVNKRVSDLVGIALSKDCTAEKLALHAPQIIVSVDEMLDILAKKYSPSDVSRMAKKSFQMPPRIPDAPRMTLMEKQAMLDSIHATKMALLLA